MMTTVARYQIRAHEIDIGKWFFTVVDSMTVQSHGGPKMISGFNGIYGALSHVGVLNRTARFSNYIAADCDQQECAVEPPGPEKPEMVTPQEVTPPVVCSVWRDSRCTT
jgi:hypothetical protein